MNAKTFFLTVLVIVVGGTIANLIALAIAAKIAQDQVNSAVATNPLLSLFSKKSSG
jgi:hypothetical protein